MLETIKKELDYIIDNKIFIVWNREKMKWFWMIALFSFAVYLYIVYSVDFDKLLDKISIGVGDNSRLIIYMGLYLVYIVGLLVVSYFFQNIFEIKIEPDKLVFLKKGNAVFSYSKNNIQEIRIYWRGETYVTVRKFGHGSLRKEDVSIPTKIIFSFVGGKKKKYFIQSDKLESFVNELLLNQYSHLKASYLGVKTDITSRLED